MFVPPTELWQAHNANIRGIGISASVAGEMGTDTDRSMEYVKENQMTCEL